MLLGGRSCSQAHKGGPGGLRSPGTILHDVECHLLAREELTGLWQHRLVHGAGSLGQLLPSGWGREMMQREWQQQGMGTLNPELLSRASQGELIS